MCGITGWVDHGRDLRGQASAVDSATATLTCRGPDAGGLWLSPHAVLGHRRLSVIDVDGGTQPMVAHDDSGRPLAALTYSGEVDNHRELRSELEARGYRFRTTSDTEVVLRAHQEWGAAAVERFTGMFAYAHWDAVTEELLLVRDRLGVKPLSWAALGSGVVFGSEPKSLLALGIRPTLDATGMAELFAVPAAPTPGRTVLAGVRDVRPGNLVRVSATGVREHRYWRPESRHHEDDAPTTVAAVRNLLGDSVRRQLISDVPLGVLLSGGLDSSAVTALAAGARAPGEKTSTFSVAFPAGEEPERLGDWNRSADAPYIAAVVDRVGAAHTDVVVRGEDLLSVRDAVLSARDRPGWGEPDASAYLLFRGVREHATAVLSGEVADEVFGGYPFFGNDSGEPFPWLRPGGTPAALLRPDVRAQVRPDEYVRDAASTARASTPRLDGEDGAAARHREVSWLALTRWLPPLLDRVDRMSMASGLEVRVPFADHRLVDYLWNVPAELKALGGTTKGLLRQAVQDLLPADVVHRPKSGYPASSSPSFGATLTARLRDLLADPHAPVFDLVDRELVRSLIDRGQPLPGPRAAPHPTGGTDHLLAVDSWLRRYRVEVSP